MMKYLFLLLPFFASGQNIDTKDLLLSNEVFAGGDTFNFPMFHLAETMQVDLDTIPSVLLCSMGDSVFIINGYTVVVLYNMGGFHYYQKTFYLDADRKELTDIIVWMSKESY